MRLPLSREERGILIGSKLQSDTKLRLRSREKVGDLGFSYRRIPRADVLVLDPLTVRRANSLVGAEGLEPPTFAL